jgi:CBS-domain-containing membrane protein
MKRQIPKRANEEAVMGTWKVADVMTADAMSVDQQAPFKQIVDIMEAFGYNALPVVDSSGRVLGLVSSADLVRKIEFAGTDEQPHLFEGRRDRTARDKAAGTSAAELMTSPAVTVLPQTTVVEAAKIMDSADLKRLPVVDELGRLTGMVTRSDLLKVFLRDDTDIRREIRSEVLADLVGVEPSQVHVEVDDGVVTLLGRLDRRSLVPVTIRHIERVAGVVDVVSHLSYRADDLDGEATLLHRPKVPMD